MTKKTLQGIATGILLTTLVFAFNFYYSDNTTIQIEIPSEEKTRAITDQDIEEYIAKNGLVVLDLIDYEKLLDQVANRETVEIDNEPNSEKIIERIVVKEVFFTIEPGTSSSSIALLLEEKGLITSKENFESYLKQKGLETKIKAGDYTLASDMSLEEIVEKLT
ncbi:hypothetical protein DS745_14570 [Anaerobacillus alkaliphilus]|uniref:Aminodeoxychorismate lyase n=1 Tax=Anaerobacillus alkaliphilus TaxID=1548597 RepID=A0A4Q0VTP4_9BACI|nr:endolytic transglycosylase MltG [Anaerobacillus alkaliphilus]RXI99444.1 hypothetical protein DS745_14570 [Anaerobacillus alkaliphilus]